MLVFQVPPSWLSIKWESDNLWREREGKRGVYFNSDGVMKPCRCLHTGTRYIYRSQCCLFLLNTFSFFVYSLCFLLRCFTFFGIAEFSILTVRAFMTLYFSLYLSNMVCSYVVVSNMSLILGYFLYIFQQICC